MDNRSQMTVMDTAAPSAIPAPPRVPCLVIRSTQEPGVERVERLDPRGAAATVLGRASDSDIALEDNAVSRRHVMVRVEGDRALVTDLGSTNGSYLDGIRLDAPAPFGPGQSLQIGRHLIAFEWRDPEQTRAAEELAKDLERASHYVASLLPRRVTEGPVHLDWAFLPSAKLGGDVFGYHTMAAGRWVAAYLIDVTGHGVGPAMHSTTILSTLRKQALPNIDFRDPAQVLTRLNDTFGMDDHDGLCFTIWYGVYDTNTRVLRYGSGGHHPAYLIQAGTEAPAPLRVRNPMMGAIPGHTYSAGEITVPPRARLHIFSDGCFEVDMPGGQQLGLEGFLDLLSGSPSGIGISCSEVEDTVRNMAGPGALADDFSIMSITFT